MFKKYRVGDLFDIHPTNAYKMSNADLYLTEGSTPVLSNSSANNGIGGYSGLEPTEKGGIITFSDTTTGGDTMFYQADDFIGRPHVQGMYPFIADKWDEKCSLYAISTIRKTAGNGWSYAVKFNRALVKELMIELPVIENSNPDHEYTVDDIDWQYMRDRITELERDLITELDAYLQATLDAYLQATGLNDYELTEDDKKIPSLSAKKKRASDEDGTLEDIGEDEVRFGEFVLGGDDGLFNIYSPKKRFNANTITFGGKYPYVARGSSNNGIRGYITEDEKYLSPAKSLSFGQDTATVYYQPDAYFTGDKIKVMVLNNRELTPELAEYFIAAIARAFSTFVWGQSSFNENIIKSMKIKLPIKSDRTPDFDYMERYIRAIEKVVIADVVKYKDAMRMLLLKEH